jgi:hypothetical protein
MTKTQKKWETVHFTASNSKKQSVTIELSFNHESKKYDICTSNEEAVSFKNDTLAISKLKLEALKECLKYIEKL